MTVLVRVTWCARCVARRRVCSRPARARLGAVCATVVALKLSSVAGCEPASLLTSRRCEPPVAKTATAVRAAIEAAIVAAARTRPDAHRGGATASAVCRAAEPSPQKSDAVGSGSLASDCPFADSPIGISSSRGPSQSRGRRTTLSSRTSSVPPSAVWRPSGSTRFADLFSHCDASSV